MSPALVDLATLCWALCLSLLLPAFCRAAAAHSTALCIDSPACRHHDHSQVTFGPSAAPSLASAPEIMPHSQAGCFALHELWQCVHSQQRPIPDEARNNVNASTAVALSSIHPPKSAACKFSFVCIFDSLDFSHIHTLVAGLTPFLVKLLSEDELTTKQALHLIDLQLREQVSFQDVHELYMLDYTTSIPSPHLRTCQLLVGLNSAARLVQILKGTAGSGVLGRCHTRNTSICIHRIHGCVIAEAVS